LDDQRKKIIISEIENWRKNHLLPEHYCIFLLNLYSAGEHKVNPVPAKSGRSSRTVVAETPVIAASGSGSSIIVEAEEGTVNEGSGGVRYVQTTSGGSQKFSWKLVLSWFLGASVIASLILLAFHFNGFSSLMQIAIFSVSTLLFYILAVFFRRRNAGYSQLFLAVSFIIVTIGGLFMIRQLDLDKTALLIFLTILFLLWCGNGLFFRLGYYLYCGLLGLGIMYGFATIGRISADYTWWSTELYWVPVSLLMIGLGFLLHERQRQLAGALAICGLLLFFGAEVQSLYIEKARQEVIQLLLFIKVFAGSALFFLTRRYWFSWLRL